MFIKAKKIINNKVVTQSGQLLGRVVDFEIDTSNQSIIKYYTHEDLLGFLKDNKIIVEDSVIPQKISEKKTTPDIEYVR